MANCVQCGKMNNPFKGNAFDLENGSFLCSSCAAFIKEELDDFYRAKTEEECLAIADLIVNKCRSKYRDETINCIISYAHIAIGYLQLETASTNGNNKGSNFFAENSFTFDGTFQSYV